MVASFVYRCGSEYYIRPLQDMLRDTETIGIVTIDSKDAAIATVNGTSITVHARMSSGVGGKHDCGGQSQNRFQRLHDEGVAQFRGRVAEKMNAIFLESGVKKIVIAGPAFCKNELADDKRIDYRVKQCIAGVVDIGYGDEAGIREALHRSGGLLDGIEYNRQRKLVQKFMEGISRGSGLSTYGTNEVRADLRAGKVATLLLSDGLDDVERRELEDMASTAGTAVEYISDATEDGAMLLKGFGGAAGLCRF
jgi:peptide chain release factor subunit 1